MTSSAEDRVLVMAPRGRDAQVICEVINGLGRAEAVFTTEALFDAMLQGAAAAVVTEEAFTVFAGSPLDLWLRSQPSWSDFPFVVLGSKRTGRRPINALASLRLMGNVILLERPLSPETLHSAVEAAVRARARQYSTRAMLQELSETRDKVGQLNRELEIRIERRTHQLSDANNRLMNEIAERERAQSALLQVQKMEAIGHLTGGIAHDFNNLLHVIGVNLDLLSRIEKTPQATRVVEVARRTVKRGAQLTAQLLAFARAQSLLPSPTDVHALLNGMRELIVTSVGSRIELRFDLTHPQAVTLLDPNQLEMSVLNLVLNARDAMQDGGTLTISTREASIGPDGGALVPAVRLTIADTGNGIPASIQEKVFEPFFTTKPMGSGTGLGLAQVYGFARQSGGDARIESSMGSGTRIHLLFPLLADAAREEIEPPPSHATTPRKHILVVEDDQDVRQSIVQSLEVMGHQVASVSNGAAALASLRESLPDLLIVDYVMPGMNGAELIGHVQASWPHIPIILATGYADMESVGKVLGAKSILKKPFGVATLTEAVHLAST